MNEEQLLQNLEAFLKGELSAKEMESFEKSVVEIEVHDSQLNKVKSYLSQLPKMEVPEVSETFLVEFNRRLAQEGTSLNSIQVRVKAWWQRVPVRAVGLLFTLVIIVGVYLSPEFSMPHWIEKEKQELEQQVENTSPQSVNVIEEKDEYPQKKEQIESHSPKKRKRKMIRKRARIKAAPKKERLQVASKLKVRRGKGKADKTPSQSPSLYMADSEQEVADVSSKPMASSSFSPPPSLLSFQLKLKEGVGVEQVFEVIKKNKGITEKKNKRIFVQVPQRMYLQLLDGLKAMGELSSKGTRKSKSADKGLVTFWLRVD